MVPYIVLLSWQKNDAIEVRRAVAIFWHSLKWIKNSESKNKCKHQISISPKLNSSSFCFTSVTLWHVQATKIHDTDSAYIWFGLFALRFALLNNSNSILFFSYLIFFFLYTCFTSVFDGILHSIRKGKKKSILNLDARSASRRILFLLLCCICDDDHHHPYDDGRVSHRKANQVCFKPSMLFALNQFLSVATNAWKYNVNMILVNSNVSLSTT